MTNESKVRAIMNFNDAETGKFRFEGTEWECSKVRADQLKKAGVAEIISKPITKTVKKELPKRTITKKNLE